MYQDFVKATIEDRERSVQQLVRERQMAEAQHGRVRWQSNPRPGSRQPNGRRGL